MNAHRPADRPDIGAALMVVTFVVWPVALTAAAVACLIGFIR